MFLFQPAGLFLSLKQPQNPERWGQISRAPLFPAPLKDLAPASPPTPPSHPLPKRGCLPASGEERMCGAPRDAGSGPTAWLRNQNHLVELRKSGRCPERQLSPWWQPHASWITGRGAGDMGRQPQCKRDLGQLSLKLSASLNSRCFLLSLAFVHVSSRDFWDSLVWSESQESWEKR